ncbi:MAG: hypothetical protein IAG10_11570 [Planctomycetaceae bacterium]|nr:hypothetical protein [Planctomycetaceae bacterium]
MTTSSAWRASRRNRDLIVDGGNDHDTIDATFLDVGRDLIVNGGAGDDDIQVSGAPAAGAGRDLKIDAGAGNDRVIADDLTAGRNVDVKLGAGNDQLEVFNASVSGINPSVKVDGGEGTDFFSTVDFFSEEAGDLLNPVLISITEDDPAVDQNGDENPIEVDAMVVREDINACFADQLNPVF